MAKISLESRLVACDLSGDLDRMLLGNGFFGQSTLFFIVSIVIVYLDYVEVRNLIRMIKIRLP